MASQQSFRNFEERLRLHANAVDDGKKWSADGTNLANLRGFSNLSLSEHARSKAERPNARRNFGNEKLSAKGKLKQKNGNFEWKQGETINGHNNTGLLPGIYNNNNANQTNNNSNITGNGSSTNSSNNNSNSSNNNNNNALDKRFKTLPPAESLPRNEMLGGYIFVCNNDTMQDDLKRLLFGLPQRYRDSVRAITPGLPLFLYNYTTHQLHGIFEAASFGGTNIDPTAWEDKKCRGESRFPAQVRIRTRKFCKPLEEDAFRPVLHHYDGPKFRLQLNIPETLALLDIFTANGAP